MVGLYAVYFGVTLVGLMSAHIYMTSRSGDAGVQYVAMIQAVPAGFTYLNLAAALLAHATTIIWGLATLAWYWPIAALFGGAVLIGPILAIVGWNRIFRLLPVFNALTVAGGLYLWIRYWPF